MNSGDKKASRPTGRVGVVSTVARTSLGVKFEAHFDEELHSEEDKYWDSDEGKWFARSQMKWFLHKVRQI